MFLDLKIFIKVFVLNKHLLVAKEATNPPNLQHFMMELNYKKVRTKITDLNLL